MAIGTQELVLCLIPIVIFFATGTFIALAVVKKSRGFALLGTSGLMLIGLVVFSATGTLFDPSMACGMIVLTGLGGIVLTIIEYTGTSKDSEVIVIQQPGVQHVVHTQTQPQVVYNVNVQNIQDSVVMQDSEENRNH